MTFSTLVTRVLEMARATERARPLHYQDLCPSMSPEELAARIRPLPEAERLREFLLGQPAAVSFLLAAIMCLGRLKYACRTDLLDLYITMSDTLEKPKHAVHELVYNDTLSEDLDNGLVKLAAWGIDLDEFFDPRQRRT
jgi:hypothetical protein